MSTVTQGSTAFGSAGYALATQGWSIDQDGRQTWVQNFKGTQTGIEALRLTFIGSGIAANCLFIPGGESTLSAIWPYEPGETEVPVDEWDYEEVPTQPSIWTHPSVAPVLTSAYKSAIETALEQGAVNPYASATTGADFVMRNVFDRLLRGTEGWEANKPMIHRVRSFSGGYGSPTTLTLTSTVYSRSSLISTFSIPADFQPRVPANPSWTAPANTTWGWRKGPQTSHYSRATRRWEERFSFEGNFWDTALYTFL